MIFQVCFHDLRQYNEPCSAGYSCAPGLSCQPGYQRCLHHPRRENERCSAGYACADGLVCRLCDKPYATCQLSRVPAMTEQVWRYINSRGGKWSIPDFARWRDWLFSCEPESFQL